MFVAAAARDGRKSLEEEGVICDQEGRTNIPGVFVAGDVSRDVQLAIIAGAEGARSRINKNLLDEDG